MKQLAYISTAVNLMSDAQLLEILKTARNNNNERSVTGVLLYSGGTFIQALEGEDTDVDVIFEAIETDSRHKNVIKLIDKPLDARNFPDWSMGFATINQLQVQEISGFLTSTDDILNGDNKQALVSILKTFIITNNMAVAH